MFKIKKFYIKTANPYYSNELIVHLRGHVRDSFNTPQLYLFLSILFIFTFICDLILNFLSRQSLAPRSIKALKSYFDYYNNIILTGVYASITVIVCYLITGLVTF